MRIHHLKIVCQDVSVALRDFNHIYGFVYLGTWQKHKLHDNSQSNGQQDTLQENKLYDTKQCCNAELIEKSPLKSCDVQNTIHTETADSPPTPNTIPRNFAKACKEGYVISHGNIRLILYEDRECQADSIIDVAFEVDNVAGVCNAIEFHSADKNNKDGFCKGAILEGPCTVTCNNESVHTPCTQCQNNQQCRNSMECALIKSPVGNMQHTLLDSRNYKGEFLPGFKPSNNTDHLKALSSSNISLHANNEQSFIEKLDHIAIAVEHGNTIRLTNWYKHIFDFSRFYVNQTETSNGLIVATKAGLGLKLFTLQPHPCHLSDNILDLGASDENMNMNNLANDGSILKEREMRANDVKLIFVESITENANDQIQLFLRSHGGAGVQHIAFHSSNIVPDVHNWASLGVDFTKPPALYYNEINYNLDRLQQHNLQHTHSDIGHNDSLVNDIIDNGILVDIEKTNEAEGFLYQVFTTPVLPSKTFFFELISRDRASGFGAGNISALWRAVAALIDQSSN